MYLTHTCIIHGLTKQEYNLLREICQYANNMYNVALYNIRQQFFRNEGFLIYEKNEPLCKQNENYGLLQANVAQQTIKEAEESFESFFALIEKAKAGEYDFKDISVPHYREKGGLSSFTHPAPWKNINRKGYFNVPMSKAFMALHSRKRIRIKVPARILALKDRLCEVRISPMYNGRYFTIQYIYTQEEEPQDTSKENTLAIDIGLDNLATCVTSTGTAFIMDGRKLKSINQHWNKRKAYYQSIADRQDTKNTRRLHAMVKNRNNKSKDYLRKTARFIVDFCIDNHIGNIVCGYNTDFTRSIDLGKRVNQQFTQVSFGYFRKTLVNLCKRYGMTYVEHEESYTSKASCLDLDEIPVYDPEKPRKYSFSGNRKKRGLYRFSDGSITNADVNGAANILRKSGKPFEFVLLRRALLGNVRRIRLDNIEAYFQQKKFIHESKRESEALEA